MCGVDQGWHISTARPLVVALTCHSHYILVSRTSSITRNVLRFTRAASDSLRPSPQRKCSLIGSTLRTSIPSFWTVSSRRRPACGHNFQSQHALIHYLLFDSLCSRYAL